MVLVPERPPHQSGDRKADRHELHHLHAEHCGSNNRLELQPSHAARGQVRSRNGCSPGLRTGEGRGQEHLARLRTRSEEHTSELQSRLHLVCRLLLEKKIKRCEIMHARLAPPSHLESLSPQMHVTPHHTI